MVAQDTVKPTRSRSSTRPKKSSVKAAAAPRHTEIAAQASNAAAAIDYSEVGDGSVGSPFRQPIRQEPNRSDCFYCPTDYCDCEAFVSLLPQVFDRLPEQRITSVAGKRHMCAKSIEPNFVSRISRVMNITSKDTFYDLGSGNGSVLFQVAYTTGAKCIGVELCPHNAELSRKAWAAMKPELERMSGRKMPAVEIITGDLTAVIADPAFGTVANTVIWTSNLLMPKPVTAYMAERFRYLAAGVRIACFDDLYPHGRSVAKLRDPDAFRQFHMQDYIWPQGSVEWCFEEGRFYIHTRTTAQGPVDDLA